MYIRHYTYVYNKCIVLSLLCNSEDYKLHVNTSQYDIGTIVNEGKKTHFLLNFTLNKIKLAQIMSN